MCGGGMIGDIFDRVAEAAQSAISSVKDTVQNNGTTKQRKLAMQWLNKGKDCYNTRSYEKAEEFFRRALTEDPAYARAHAYLGNALYSADRAAWQDAYSMLAADVRADLAADSAYWRPYRDTVVKKASNTVYNSFLVDNGQTLGLKSYGACVDLLVNYYGGAA